MKRTQPTRLLLRPGEVAELFGVTTQTLRNWTKRGGSLHGAVVRIPGMRQWRYDAATVRALVRKGQRGVA